MDICGACGVQKNDAMVQCDRCDTWWHFGCVGVDESVSERSFICPKCENSTSLLQSQPTTGVELIPPIDSISLTSRRSSVSNASARARLNLEKLEVKKALAEKTLNLELREQERKLELARLQNEGELERKKLELQREYEEERIRLMEEELVEEEERSVRSQQSSSSKVRQWRSQLQFGGACSTMRYPAANEARGERNVKVTTTTTTAASDVPVSQPLNSTSRLTEEAANNHQQAGDGGNGFEVQALPKAKTCIGTGAVPKQLPTSTPSGEIVKSFPPPSMPSVSAHPSGVEMEKSHTRLANSRHTIGTGSPGPLSGFDRDPLNSIARASIGLGVPQNKISTLSVSNVAQAMHMHSCESKFLQSEQVSFRPTKDSSVLFPTYASRPIVSCRESMSRVVVDPLMSTRVINEASACDPSVSMKYPRTEAVPGRHRDIPSSSLGVRQRDEVKQHVLADVTEQQTGRSSSRAPREPNTGDILQSIRTGSLPQGGSGITPDLPGFQRLNTVNLQVDGPSATQIAARQVMPRDLPLFSGNPEDWPVFISSFNNSSQACGYTDAENLIRLQRCLKGTALEAVRSRLLFPAAVPHVIATLETLYGKPEHLIFMLVKKVREVPAPKSDKLETLIGFGMAVQNLCDHVEMGQQEAHLNNPTLLYELVDKLPANLKLDWALFKQEAPVTNLRTFAQFMSRLVTAAADVTLHIEPRAMQKVKLEKPREKIFLGAHAGSKHINDATKMSGSQGHSGRSENSIVCLVCKDTGHKVRECKQFGDMTVDERWKTIQAYSLCRTCIGAHGKRPCKSKKLCDIEGCQAKHHTLLHSTQTRSEVSEPIRGIMNHHHAARSSLFRILPVTLFANNRSIVVYAFLDEGSSRTLIEEDVIKRLGVDGEPSPLCLQWTANIKRFEKNSRKVSLEIAGGSKNYRYQLFDAQTVNRLDLPRQSMRYAEMVAKYPYLEGLPIEDYANAVPKILIGNDHSHLGASLKIREGNPQEPIAAKSRLGWTIYGSVSGASERALSFHICSCETNASLHELVKKYFSIESLGVKAIDCPESKEVQRANRILQHTTRRVGQRYETGLIWKYTIKFPDSYQMAKKRMLCLERRMAKNSIIGNSVKKQIIEYQEKGYIHPATETELKEADPQKIWYLPLGVALNPKKPDKIRIFCDAATMVEGVSLNSMLLKGPDLISSLPAVLFGFREKRFAICADIKEMFHQIQIRKEDRNAQRLLWRDDTETEPVTYIMDVATFGSTCSPCSAQYVKNLNASSQAVEFPRAADAIIRKHYVDDYLDSADTIDEAVQLAKDVRTVHFRGGFHIRNWMSNSGEVLRRVGEISSATKKDLVLDRTSATERILGMLWSPEQDEFSYSASMLVAQQRPTKRIVLRVVMSLFDPLGLMSFFVIHGKILIQDIWRAKTEWDEPIPEKLCQRWWQWTKLCEQLDCIRIARCYFPDRHTNEFLSLQLHVFVDASEGAYACVAYLRAEYDGTVECALVAAKSKVAPLKSLSIPRLELQAAVLGVRLQKMIRQAHGLAIGECFYHTDSKNVLAWIKSDHRNYRQFVAVRVGEILTESTEQEWRWVPSKENVADDATKWGNGPCFLPHSRWFRGPEFLYRVENEWPVDKQSKYETTDEIRTCLVHQEVRIIGTIEWSRFSKWNRLWRTTAYVLRYLNNLRRYVRGEQLQYGALTREELAEAEVNIWRQVQNEAYAEEIRTIEMAQQSSPGAVKRNNTTSKLYQLSPFVDAAGVLRSESRIPKSSFVSYDTRCPIILPKNSWATVLLVEWYHRKFLHANGETVLNEMRQRYHVSGLRTLIRIVAKRCNLCRLRKTAPSVPRMAPLPETRTQAFTRPFSYVGLDYFGPLAVRVGRATVKRWVALFTCLTIRAVHLEVVHSLSTESCKMAIRRFVARRGAPVEFHSDNGTNFVGASNDLRKELTNVNAELAETFTNSTTRWCFIPPSAPHMGGAWERLVRSIKTALQAMYTTRIPDEETFGTLIVEAESIVNSRPLTFVPVDPNQEEALTPNHFLLLSSRGVTQPVKSLAEPGQACKSSWNLCRIMVDSFWRRWIREYLPTIARRTKWFEEVKPVDVGDLVIVVTEVARNGWIRGRIIEVIRGRDGRIRQAVVQTSKGVIRRPIAKLAVLDVMNSNVAQKKSGTSHESRTAVENHKYPSAGDCCACPSRGDRSGKHAPVDVKKLVG
ncbi:uncharacterized protein LOC134206679 [Armigeres subalbatus]|uniref:uncharacterized protein LOC134206679 n=1 Tax=Armigeres subalbatus TaxID=124917 RepID=UPI002ED596E6